MTAALLSNRHPQHSGRIILSSNECEKRLTRTYYPGVKTDMTQDEGFGAFFPLGIAAGVKSLNLYSIIVYGKFTMTALLQTQ